MSDLSFNFIEVVPGVRLKGAREDVLAARAVDGGGGGRARGQSAAAERGDFV